jgi:uncharacterized protein YecE (DUF72 family)
MARIFAGTSGFAYPGWKPRFYPPEISAKRFLSHYASRLNVVEINYTFRRHPLASTLEHWVRTTPPGFLFATKAHQRITHIMRMKDAATAVEFFFRTIDPLRSSRRLGPVLFQLPPTLKCDAALLSDFVQHLPDDLRHTFEFRHPSWLTDEVYGILERRKLCLCLAESEKLEIPPVITSDFVYFRLRKADYTEADREAIAAKARELIGQGRDVFLFFKHEDTPEGALYAEEILQAVNPSARAASPASPDT